MAIVRIGCVKYLNTLPLIEGLEACRDLALVAAAPSKLAPMLRAGEVDLALASVVDVGTGDLDLVPVGMIGCDGPTMTVRLYSRVAWASVRRVYADTDSHTSVILAQLILAARFGVTAEVADFDARERIAPGHASAGEWPETLLLIGDKAVTDAPPTGAYVSELDLGEAWREWTGLPFVYAMWMCRAGEMARPHVAAAAVLLDRQRRRNAMRLEWIIQKHAAARRWPTHLARTYLAELLRYDVDERAREGVSRFLNEAAAAGLLLACEPRWAHVGASAQPVGV
ncbi:MAG: menaquinone biosynthetic enzyme MqnA/MqnD family protein [Phycisphaerales bacterium]